jgi:hypothetical protein
MTNIRNAKAGAATARTLAAGVIDSTHDANLEKLANAVFTLARGLEELIKAVEVIEG